MNTSEEEAKTNEVDPKFGCQHYKRRCQLSCSECDEFHTCRFCHDDLKYYNERDHKKIHKIDRYTVNQVRCLNCETVQKPQQNCEKCDIQFASYFCKVCNLFDDEGESKMNYHCDKCNVCRVGGEESSFHCDNCECCYDFTKKDTHTC